MIFLFILGYMMSVYAEPCLERGGQKQIFAEMYPILGHVDSLGIHGRIVREKVGFSRMEAVPKDDISMDERKRGEVFFRVEDRDVGTSKIDREGWVFAKIQEQLPVGEHVLRVYFRSCLIGETSIRVLPKDYQDIVIRSDVDMTYLNTDFHSMSAKMALLEQSAKQRESLEGMAEVYRILRNKEKYNRPLSFISGSPAFFKRVLENKMLLDGVQYDEVVLKPFKFLLAKKWVRAIPLLKEQIGYKLDALLRMRQHLPAQSKEILLGDDTEADPIVYAIYAQLLQKKQTEEELLHVLRAHHVSSYWITKITEQLPSFWASIGDQATVLHIYIHQTKESTDAFDSWKETAPIFFHTNAKELIQELQKQDWMK